jgi:tryptophan halogenase
MAQIGADNGPIRSIVIVGGGTAGWMSAALLARLFGKTFAITLIESDEIGAIGVGEATIPGIKHYNRLVGIDENAFLKATGGTYKLGIEFVDWTRLGDRYMHGFGYFGQNLGWLRLHQYWLKALKAGRAAPLGDYSINTMAAYANRFSPARADMPQSPLGQIQHAYHFDATLYARFLRAMAEDLGVRRIEGKITEVVLDPQRGHVSGVRLESGALHSGELFIDCSGQRPRPALRFGRAADALYPLDRPHRRLDLAHSAPAPHRQRHGLFKRAHFR